jgi:glucose-6-phosphate isomerase
MNYTNLDKTAAYKRLAELASGSAFDLAARLDGERVQKARVPMAGGLTYSWAAKAVGGAELAALQALADEQELIAKYQALLDGETMNSGEKRKVLHHLLRGQMGKAVIHEGRNLGDFYARELERFSAFAGKVHTGELRGSTGTAFTHAVQIGIGGSDLGPRALYLALEQWAKAAGKAHLQAAFISNVDPDDASGVVAALPLDRTVFVLVSKSGTTQETLSNELFVKAKLLKAGLDPRKHLVAVTSETSPLAHNPAYLDSFYIDDYIGGR